MLGAIIGDIVGSPYEFSYNRMNMSGIPFWNRDCRFTDDTVMTLAVADALMRSIDEGSDFRQEAVKSMRRFALRYPAAGYGGRFSMWVVEDDPQPYGSWGNGSAMRVSSVGWAFESLDETERMAAASADVTHNHPEGIKGAQATAAAIFLARTGSTKERIKAYIEERFGYDLGFTIEQIRPEYSYDVSCQGSVPQSIVAFLEAQDYEQTVKLAISLGGDTDTMACIGGSIAEAFWGVPEEIALEGRKHLDPFLNGVLDRWSEWLARRSA